MWNCPECENDIKRLEWENRGIVSGGVIPDSITYLNYTAINFEYLHVFLCPECGEELFYNEQDAANFFKGNFKYNKRDRDEEKSMGMTERKAFRELISIRR